MILALRSLEAPCGDQALAVADWRDEISPASLGDELVYGVRLALEEGNHIVFYPRLLTVQEGRAVGY